MFFTLSTQAKLTESHHGFALNAERVPLWEGTVQPQLEWTNRGGLNLVSEKKQNPWQLHGPTPETRLINIPSKLSFLQKKDCPSHSLQTVCLPQNGYRSRKAKKN